MSDLKAIQTYLDRNSTADYIQGEIKSISGNTAYVKIQGADRFQEAWLGKNSGLSAGDVCVMIRLKQSSKWVIVNGYGTSYQGSDDTVSTPLGYATASYANASLNSSTGWTQLISVDVQKALSDTKLMLNATVYTGIGSLGGWGMTTRYKVNGNLSPFIAGVNDNFGGSFYGYGAWWPMFQVIPNLSAGKHVVSIDAYGGPSLIQIAFYVSEVS
jgi:hypothetical protein